MTRRVVRGRQVAAGLLIDPSLVGMHEVRRRVLEVLGPGDRVFRTELGLLVRWASPRVVREPYPGTVMLACGARLSAIPLDDPPFAVTVLVGGQLRALGIEAEDPAEWLGLTLPVLDGVPLGALPGRAEAQVVPVSVDATAFGLRLDPERDQWAEGLVHRPPPRGLERVLRGLGRGLAEGGRAVGAVRIGEWLQRFLGTLADRLGLSSLFGQRYVKFFDDLLRRFEEGDVLEALRRALPLGGAGGSGPAALGPFGSLPVRTQLGLHLGPRVSVLGRAFGAGPSLYERLQQLYRAAADRMEREGRIEIAAFVYDELLRDPLQAVALLERHDQWALAAQLAEARRLPAGLIVRLWWRAGDTVRAVGIARREGAWLDAVVRLNESDGPEAASALRRLWAVALAHQGRYQAAVDVAGADPALRDRALAWMDRAIDEAGAAGGALLARRLQWAPHTLGRLAEVTARWAAHPEPVAFTALIEALSSAGPSAETTSLTRLVARLAAGRADLPAGPIQTIVARHAAGPIGRDLPDDPPDLATAIEVHHDEVGGAPILDAARAADGSWVVALGEAGVLHLDPTGRPLRHHEWPTEAIVVCGEGNRFVLVGPGCVRRLAHLDLAGGVAPWADVLLDAWVPVCDGDLWVVGVGTDVLGIDLLSERWKFLWRVPECGGSVRAVSTAPHAVYALVGGGGDAEVWRWELPGHVLRERRRVGGPPLPGVHAGRLALSDSGAVVVLGVSNAANEGPARAGDRRPPAQDAAAVWAAQGPVHLLLREEGGLVLRSAPPGVYLRGARRGGVRASSSGTWVFDHLGRLVFVDRRQRARVIRVFA